MRPLKRPMFRTGGPIKEGLMNGLREGGVATTMADATGYAGGGKVALVGNPVFPKGPDGRAMHANIYASSPEFTGTFDTRTPNQSSRFVNLGGGNAPRTTGGVTNTNVAKDLTKMQKAKNMLQKSKSFIKKPVFSERGLKYLFGRKVPQTAKGIARFIGSFAGGAGSRFPISTLVGKRALPYYAMYKASEVTPVDAKYGISRTDNLFAPFKSNTVEIIQKKALRNAEQAANPNNFYRYDSGKYGPRKDHPLYDPKKIRYNPFSDDKGAADTEIPRDADGNIIRFQDAESMFGLKKLKATPGYSKEEREIEKEKVKVPKVTGTKEERDAYAKKYKEDQDKEKLDKIYNLLGVKKAQANAASKALIDMSRYIDEGGKDTISRKNIGSTISKAIGAFDKRLDKADQLKEAAGLMIAKGEIEKDIYGAKPGTQLKAAQDYQAQFGGTLKDAYKALGIGRKDMSVTVSESLIKGARKSTDLIEAAYQAEGNPPAVLTVKSKDFKDWQDSKGDDESQTELDYVKEITDRKPGAYVVGTRVVIVDKELNPSFYY